MSLVVALLLAELLLIALQIVFGAASMRCKYENMDKWVIASHSCGAGVLILTFAILALNN